MNVKALTHSQQQPQGPKAHKKKSTIRLTYRTVFCVLQRSLLYIFFVLMKSSARHTLSNKTQLKNLLRAVHLTENNTKHSFQAPCCCCENGLAMDLQLVETINVSIDCVVIKYLISMRRKLYSIERQHKVLFGFVFV